MGWFLATILAPFYAPILIVVFSAVGESQSVKSKIRPILLVKDGQLCWLAIGFALRRCMRSRLCRLAKELSPQSALECIWAASSHCL